MCTLEHEAKLLEIVCCKEVCKDTLNLLNALVSISAVMTVDAFGASLQRLGVEFPLPSLVESREGVLALGC